MKHDNKMIEGMLDYLCRKHNISAAARPDIRNQLEDYATNRCDVLKKQLVNKANHKSPAND